MSDKPVNESRRGALKAMVGGLAAAPLMNLVGLTAAQAGDAKEDLPPLDMEDGTAKALKYVHEAPADKKEAKQICSTCQFIQADTGDWRPCQLFPRNTVSAGVGVLPG